MKNNIISITLGLVLLAFAPALAKESTKSQDLTTSQARTIERTQSQVVPTEPTEEVRRKTAPKLQRKLLKVREVRYLPRGRGRYDKVPEPKPWYADVF